MTLTPEEISEIKAQLREQVNHLPAQQKEAALKQIEQMSPQAVEALLNQQRAKKTGGQGEQDKTVYRMIVDGEIPSTKVDENDWAIAVLEINPISKGHTLIMPKTLVKEEKDLPKKATELAETVSKRIIKSLKASKTEIINQTQFGEVIINVIPIYDSPLTISSPRNKATSDELSEISKKLKAPPKKIPIIRVRKPSAHSNQILKLPRRIP